MKIKCPECDTTYDVAEEVANSGAQVQCAKCTGVFTATPYLEAEPSAAPEAENTNDLLNEEEKDFFANFSAKLSDEKPDDIVDEADALPVTPKAEETEEEEIDIGWAETDEPPEPVTEPVTEPEAESNDGFEVNTDNPDEVPFDDFDLDLKTDPEPAPDAMVMEEPKTVVKEPAPDTEAAPAEPVVESEEEPSAKRFASPVIMGWGALAASVAFVFISATLFRVPISKALPGMAGLYEKVGLPVNIRGLEFYSLSHQWMKSDGRMRLVVRGEIVNITDDSMPVPEIIFAMLDGNNHEFFQWTEHSGTKQLAPQARTRFRAQIPAPADRVRQLKIRFAKR